ncbi:MAG: leucine-rich repeat protein [Ruminococcus sp.]|nr:leucine-rich repeat protein [Ruminococcus sp.]
MKKRILSFITAIAMVVGFTICLPTISVGAMTLTSGDYEYEILEDGTAEITRYNGSDAEIELPSEIDGYVVTSIGSYSFADNEGNISISSIIIPESVTSIEAYAFYNLWRLTEVTIPTSVTSIGYHAFDACYNLESITIPSSVTSIGKDVFILTYDGGDPPADPIVIISCYSGSYAEQYAIDNDIEYVLLEKLGDVNGDDKVTTADVGLANSHAKGVKTLTDEQFVMADVNEDGSVTTADVGLINAHAKGVSLLW